MSGVELKEDGDGKQVATSQPAPAVLGSAPVSAPTLGNGLQYPALTGNQQYPILDPNVMMMTNAAATIAAVAASAVQQMANHVPKGAPMPAPGSAGVPANLVAALRGPARGASAPAPNSVIAPQIAALLGATANGAQGVLPSGIPAGALRASLPQALASLAPTGTDMSVAVAPTSHPIPAASAQVPSMQNWTLNQLEKHVTLLTQLNQPVPQSVALLLGDAKRKDKKRTAKRAANRKSASTSRARKKALVEEMTKTNARLKRQALILALLPDLVVAVTGDGEITFCSDQVERVLQHPNGHLLGGNLSNLLMPASKDVLKGLTAKLLPSSTPTDTGVEQEAITKNEDAQGAGVESRGPAGAGGSGAQNDPGGESNSREQSGAAIVSEQSFPLSVVQVESRRARIATTGSGKPGSQAKDDNSDESTRNSNGKEQTSSVTNSASFTRSPPASSGEDETGRGSSSRGSGRSGGNVKKTQSSDDSSSLSSDTKNVRNASENLGRNVRYHNERMLVDGPGTGNSGPKDDVTGASVTANNATARLSSLQHLPEPVCKKYEENAQYENAGGDQSSTDDSLLNGVEEKKKGEQSASDDSGYRESNDSRGETSSSDSDTANSNGDPASKKQKLSPTCRMWLIRKDLSTVLCEVTCSVRSGSIEEDSPEPSSTNTTSSLNEESSSCPPQQELLLCLRPIRDGDKKADPSLSFVCPPNCGLVDMDTNCSKESALDGPKLTEASELSQADLSPIKKTTKKRTLPKSNGRSKAKKSKKNDANASETEKSVVESLMLMNKAS